MTTTQAVERSVVAVLRGARDEVSPILITLDESSEPLAVARRPDIQAVRVVDDREHLPHMPAGGRIQVEAETITAAGVHEHHPGPVAAVADGAAITEVIRIQAQGGHPLPLDERVAHD